MAKTSNTTTRSSPPRSKRPASAVKLGDHVRWSTPQGPTHGIVTRTVTGSARAGGHTAHASPEAPQLEVRSDKTGNTAIHHPAALHKTTAKR